MNFFSHFCRFIYTPYLTSKNWLLLYLFKQRAKASPFAFPITLFGQRLISIISIFALNFYPFTKNKIKYTKDLSYAKNPSFKKGARKIADYWITNSFLIYNLNVFLRKNLFIILKTSYYPYAYILKLFEFFLKLYKRTTGEGLLYLRGLFLICFVDACLTDDEPLWEPIEWSLVQTWLFFIFIFAWIAENLITSRYGSYTGRDKRVWLAWYKTFWLIELWYFLTYLTAALFVITPFYYELTYDIAFAFSWWDWYTRIFFFKFVSTYSVILFLSYVFHLSIRWLNWKKLVLYILLINFFIAYLLYSHFIIAFFAYFTDPLWYQKSRIVDYIQLSHEPLKWGWGPAKRDHFSYHHVSTVFWYKNDSPFAGSFLMIHLFFFICIFFLYVYWLVLLRKTYATKEITYTFATYCVSSLRQFFIFFFLFYSLVFISFITNYWRFPVEFFWISNANSWFFTLFYVLLDYPFFILNFKV